MLICWQPPQHGFPMVQGCLECVTGFALQSIVRCVHCPASSGYGNGAVMQILLFVCGALVRLPPLVGSPMPTVLAPNVGLGDLL